MGTVPFICALISKARSTKLSFLFLLENSYSSFKTQLKWYHSVQRYVDISTGEASGQGLILFFVLALGPHTKRCFTETRSISERHRSRSG